MSGQLGNRNASRTRCAPEVMFALMKEFAAQPEGVTAKQVKDLAGVCPSTTYLTLTTLMEAGLIHRMVHGRDVAYFLTPEAAEAQRAVLLRKYGEMRRARRRVENAKRLAKAELVVKVAAPKTPATRQPARGPAHLPGPAVTTAATIHRVYPTPPWPTRTTTHSVY